MGDWRFSIRLLSPVLLTTHDVGLRTPRLPAAAGRQRERERRALPGRAFDPDAAAVELRNLAHDRQTNPCPADPTGDARLDALEAVKDALHVLRQETDALITHRQDDFIIEVTCGNRHRPA